jgi:hypothetical protein
MKVFCSGSCRLLTTIHNGRGKLDPIHSMFYNFVGINFLGKLHDTKQHIQFLQFIKGEIDIPQSILPLFLTSYNPCKWKSWNEFENEELLPMKRENIKNQFNECEWFLFEICSLKLYKKDHFYVQCEQTNDYITTVQTKEDLWNDLCILRKMVPNHLLLQVHFRPNIIYEDETKSVENREIIYNTVKLFCEQHEKTFMYDPSILLQNHSFMYDDTHFNDAGHMESFNYICNFISKYTV